MRLFSHRQRPVHLGAFPLERLPRLDRAPDVAAEPLREHRHPAEVPTNGALPLARATGEYFALLDKHRDGPLAPRPAAVPDDPLARANDLKAACYFLDATMAATCALPAGGATEGHTHALIILVERPRAPKPGEPGYGWLHESGPAVAALRAAELAVVMAGYIRRLGYAATAHTATTSGVDAEALAVRAGLLERADGRLVNPFVGERFALAAVTTTYRLAEDRPLAPRGFAEQWRALGPTWWLGFGGTRPGWKRLADDLRPLHLGRYPMEKIRRVNETTTLITANVPRMPKRANFFTRALKGDLGDKAKRERTRFATKHPFANAMTPLIQGMVPLQRGQVANASRESGDPAASAEAIKAAAYFLGADMVGICEAVPFTWYSHHDDGTPIEPYHKYAVVMLIDQGFETMEGSSGDDWISGAQSMRAYMRGAEIAGVLAAHIRGLGHSATSHTNAESDVLHIPLILLAGLGELSRIGELVLNPFVGPRFKSVVLTTDMPLTVDKPIDFGLQDFCDSCMKCARECPCDAISWGGKVMFNGYEMWKPDVERCARYRVTNPKGSACGRCMKTCPYNAEGLLIHRAFLWAAIRWKWTRPWIARLDDKVGNGKRNTVKKWWFDLELVDGVATSPRGANARDLNLAHKLDPAEQKVALYPFETAPPPGQSDPYPVDRAEALRRGAAAVAAGRPSIRHK